MKVSEWEEVEAIESETARYEADIFVDASGFRRIIASQLDGFTGTYQNKMKCL